MFGAFIDTYTLIIQSVTCSDINVNMSPSKQTFMKSSQFGMELTLNELSLCR